MKRAIAFLGGLTLALHLQADPSVDWVSDSYNSFDVILNGTGPGWSGSITSPSGLWQLYTGNILQYPFSSSNPSQPPIMIGNSGYATFLGPLPPGLPAPDPQGVIHSVSIGTAGGYQQFFNLGDSVAGQNPLNYGYLGELSFYGSFQDWGGMSTFSVTSMPNPSDVSTWTWTAEYQASGASLAAPAVPEPGPVSLGLLAVATGCAWGWAKKRGRTLLRPQ